MKTREKMRELELYLHIPFCVRKCRYCDFLSFPAGEEVREKYVEALCREIREKAQKYPGGRVVSVFFGGGTPSLLTARQLERICKALYDGYRIEADAEISMEVNPGTVTGESLAAYRSLGINRLSIGLQSAEEEELQMLGRIHSYPDFLQSFADARTAGFTNINVDLMSGLPGQSLASYEQTLQKVLQQEPEHISAYSLIIEEGTPFYEMEKRGELILPSEDLDREMVELTGRLLKEHGLERYEISNYAKPGYACRHNIGYWKRRNYLGFGLGAASLWNPERFQNTGNPEKYFTDSADCTEHFQRLTKEEEMEEFLFLGLRLCEGISAREFQENFGFSLDAVYGDVVRKHEKEGLLIREDRNGESRLHLTERGFDLANYVMADFLEPVLPEALSEEVAGKNEPVPGKK